MQRRKMKKSFLKYALKKAEKENKVMVEVMQNLVDKNRELTEKNANLSMSENTKIISLMMPYIIEEDKRTKVNKYKLKNT
jgi:hypothetical protein